MVEQIKCLVNMQGEMLEILQEIREPLADEKIVNLSNYYDVLNEGRYNKAIYDFNLKKWVGVGEQRPIVVPQLSENEILKSQINLLQAKVQASAEVAKLQEELIVELAMMVYS